MRKWKRKMCISGVCCKEAKRACSQGEETCAEVLRRHFVCRHKKREFCLLGMFHFCLCHCGKYKAVNTSIPVRKTAFSCILRPWILVTCLRRLRLCLRRWSSVPVQPSPIFESASACNSNKCDMALQPCLLQNKIIFLNIISFLLC